MPGETNFQELESLKKYLASIRLNHTATKRHYVSNSVMHFYHHPQKPDEPSLSSPATCVSSLVHAGHWTPEFDLWDRTSAVSERLVKPPWKSSGLKANNPFTLFFIIEGGL